MYIYIYIGTLTTNDGKEEVIVFTLTIASEILQGWTIDASTATIDDGQVTFNVPLRATSTTGITIESFATTGGNLPSALIHTETVNTLISAGMFYILYNLKHTYCLIISFT